MNEITFLTALKNVISLYYIYKIKTRPTTSTKTFICCGSGNECFTRTMEEERGILIHSSANIVIGTSEGVEL